MDKKDLIAIVQEMVEEVAKLNDISESAARVFVGVALQKNKDAFLQCVVLPRLALAEQQPNVAEAA